MMQKPEIEQLGKFIAEFEQVIRQTESGDGTLDNLYEMVRAAYLLYGEDIVKLEEAYEEIINYSGTLRPNSRNMLRLLQRYLVQQEYQFEAGIMPVTYENLSCCPAAQKVYKDGMDKYAEGQYERNVLDDVRLSLELLVKQLLGNDKSLENQKQELLGRLKSFHGEIRNYIWNTINYLSDYQNHYVKHNDAVRQEELEFIIEQTSAVINFLTKVKVE